MTARAGACASTATGSSAATAPTGCVPRPDTFAETGAVNVTRDGEPVTSLNELECVDGQVWANIWKSNDDRRGSTRRPAW